MYTEKVMDHFQHPRNMGEIENASGVGTVGNAKCGDIMRIYLDIDDNGIINDVKFKTFGCGAAVATSSMATELVKGKHISEAMGILAGDALLNYAFETAVKAFEIAPEKSLLIGKALKILADKAGIYGMVGGQVVDVASCGIGLDEGMLNFIYELKTGALIESSMMIGALLAGADEAELEKVQKIASDVGIAFQIQDDILDVTSTTEELGKPVHSDEKNEKTTYVTLKGLEKATADVEAVSQEALELLSGLDRENAYLTQLIQELIHRKK